MKNKKYKKVFIGYTYKRNIENIEYSKYYDSYIEIKLRKTNLFYIYITGKADIDNDMKKVKITIEEI